MSVNQTPVKIVKVNFFGHNRFGIIAFQMVFFIFKPCQNYLKIVCCGVSSSKGSSCHLFSSLKLQKLFAIYIFLVWIWHVFDLHRNWAAIMNSYILRRLQNLTKSHTFFSTKDLFESKYLSSKYSFMFWCQKNTKKSRIVWSDLGSMGTRTRSKRPSFAK